MPTDVKQYPKFQSRVFPLPNGTNCFQQEAVDEVVALMLTEKEITCMDPTAHVLCCAVGLKLLMEGHAEEVAKVIKGF